LLGQLACFEGENLFTNLLFYTYLHLFSSSYLGPER
jgi:hypothetical protein